MQDKKHLRLSTKRKKRRLGIGLKRRLEEQRKQKVQKNAEQEGGKDKEKISKPISGRRIVNIVDFINQIQDLDRHSPCGCSFKDMKAIGEKRKGLNSGLIFKCAMCHITRIVWTDKSEKVMDVNTAAVSGTVTTGGGHAQLEEMLSTMDIPPMSDKTFRKYEYIVSKGWMATAQAEMSKAAEEEARLAREHGEVVKDGVPLITVVADGSWCKRSYRTNYSSLSGAAAIVGLRTKKFLFVGVKNKYCTSCARAESSGESAKQHPCYKNWGQGQSSSSMEAAIVLEGFMLSEEMYGVRYSRLIADGDSSVYKKILEKRPYKSTTVEKVECKNHLLRNFSNKLKHVAVTSTRSRNTVCLRKKVGDSILRCRMAVTKATDYRKKEENTDLSKKISNLREDILNVPSHIFGEHKNCATRGYFCELTPSTAPTEKNLIPQLISSGLYDVIKEAFIDMSRHSRSLIFDVTSNTVEHYNSIIAKFIGGKRINFAMKGSYEGRCSAAVVQHNTQSVHYSLHKSLYKCSPGLHTKTLENKRKRKTQQKRDKKRPRKNLFPCETVDLDYGPMAQQADIEPQLMEIESTEFLEKLKKTQEEIDTIQNETVHQSDSSQWLETRRNLLTASNFGRVCKMKPTTGCESLVKQLLYTSFDCEAMAYGRKHEETARQQICSELGITVRRCGLFIHHEYPFLGASPDGLIDEDGLVEIKCPSSATNLTPEEAIANKKVTFWKLQKDGQMLVQRNHNFFFQIQGQLMITNRQYCLFVLWTPKGRRIERIERDDDFWKKEMIGKLERFYKNCILPELIDPRQRRSMPIRNPSYILEAKKKQEERRRKQSAPKSDV